MGLRYFGGVVGCGGADAGPLAAPGAGAGAVAGAAVVAVSAGALVGAAVVEPFGLAGAGGVVTPSLLAPDAAPVLSLLFSPAVSRIDFGCDVWAECVPMYVSRRLLSMKIATKMAVARDNAVPAPRAPKTVPEAPEPKPAPASAPLPR